MDAQGSCGDKEASSSVCILSLCLVQAAVRDLDIAALMEVDT
jgi:hypothetical protein